MRRLLTSHFGRWSMAAVAGLVPVSTVYGQCETWSGFGGLPGVVGATCSTAWDPDGVGPSPARLVVGSYSRSFGDSLQNYIAMWNGSQWIPIGGGTDGAVWALCTTPNGDLVASGFFTQAGGTPAAGIARWNGTSWSPLGSGVESGFVYALTALPNGDIILGGEVSAVGGQAVSHIARWNGASWDSMNGGVTAAFSASVRSLLALPDGTLIAGGFFSEAGGTPAGSIARWDGTSWTAFTAGLSFGGTVESLAGLNNGDIIAGGNFSEIDGVFVQNIARWDGSAWSDMGGGMSGGFPPFSFPEVFSLAALSSGELVAAGLFDMAGGTPANSIARWDGASWSALGEGLAVASTDPAVHAIVRTTAALPAGRFAALGSFDRAGSGVASGAAVWTGSAWERLGGGTSNPVFAVETAPNGDTIAAGAFQLIGGVEANRIARWNGSAWAPLGAGLNNLVLAVAVAPGGDVIAAGRFTEAGGVPASKIARWNGTSWQALGAGISAGGDVLSVAVMPNGDIVAGGNFMEGTWPAVSSIVRWDGASWSLVGNVVSSAGIWALHPMPNGDLVAGGDLPGGVARWDGSAWHALGDGLASEFSGAIALDITGLPDGDLVVAGDFSMAGGQSANSIARWDGAAWHALGSGLQGPFPDFPRQVYQVRRRPSGDLIAVGNFTTSGEQPLAGIGRWDGASWHPLEQGLGNPDDPAYVQVFAAAVRADGEVIAGGEFRTAGAVAAPYVARWQCPANPCSAAPSWRTVAPGGGTNGAITSSCIFNGSLYVGGFFSTIDGQAAHGMARLDGAMWTPISVEPGANIYAMVVHDDGSGPAVYVAGDFASAGGVPAANVARWDGSSWSALGPGVNTTARALESLDLDGPGGKPARLYVGGAFTMAGGAAAAHIACWNGVSWAPLGEGVNGSARVMKVWDDGSGPALFVGGDFDLAGGAPANFIAKWNGAWSALQSGLGNFPASMEAFDDGDGERLYVSGPFFSAGSASAQIIATWDGTTWAALPVEPNRPAQSLRVFNDGSGEALYAGGPFTEFGGALISGVVRWNGVSWTPLGTGVTQGGDLPSVTTLCVFDADGPGPAPAGLFAGGVFDGAGALHVQNLAVWRGSSGGPVFTNQPGSTLRYTGQAITLSAAATGQGALGYQWRKNGQLLTDGGRISGAMTNALVISPAVLSDAAEYDVVAMDDCGTLTSSGATVTVICYANCDHSTGIPPLTSNDFQCFLNRFAAGDSYANCDGSTGTPALTSNDFQCFLNSFAAGCP